MAGLPTGSVDTIITDPPYGLSFMGKRWDYEIPSIAQFAEMLRVLKPGGTMLCFAGSRTQHRMACNVEDAGFILKDCILWLYGSGFPKATDISKQLDKQAGVERPKVPGGVGTDAGYSGGFQPGEATSDDPITDEAKLWDGWKSHGLKPAYEPIIVAMKCNEGSYANNALTHGVAGLNIDAGRIDLNGEKSPTGGGGKVVDSATDQRWGFVGNGGNETSPKGRFPANVILDEQAAAMLDEQSGESVSTDRVRKNNVGWGTNGIYGKGDAVDTSGFNDSGGASRFFYCAKASKAERNEGCGGLEKRCKAQLEGANNDRTLEDLDDVSKRYRSQPMANIHPTVKPLALMEYLCKLTSTPTGGIVLDPFAGSGTTGLAAYNTGRDYICIERDPEYIKIIKARLAGAKEKLGLFEK